jgi:hypothetical protein
VPLARQAPRDLLGQRELASPAQQAPLDRLVPLAPMASLVPPGPLALRVLLGLPALLVRLA